MADKGIIDGNYAFILRGNEKFKIIAKNIFTEIHAFICRKCNHIWLPKDRDFTNLPLHCPKCYDKYWFASHNEIIKLRQKTFSEEKEVPKKKLVW